MRRKKLGITTPLPKSLTESLAALESDGALQAVLGEELANGYVTVKRAEKEMLDRMDESTRYKWLIERY